MTFKRLLCAILALLMLSGALVSCANDSGDEPGETSGTAVTESPDDAPVFEERDYSDEEFKFLIYNQKEALVFYDEYIWNDGITGGTINDAVTERNRRTEEKYGLTITAEVVSSPIGEAKKRMQAGQCDFDVIYEWNSRLVPAALDGQLYNFDNFTYSHFDREFWIPSAIESMTVADKRFISTNYATMSSIGWASVVFFNKNLMDKYGYDYPYEAVQNGTWTVDYMIELIEGGAEDLNGDGTMGYGDQFAQMACINIGSVCDEPTVKQRADGTYEVIGYTERMLKNYEDYVHVFERIKENELDYGTVWEDAGDISEFDNQWNAARQLSFGAGNVMFLGGVIDYTKDFINMKDTYGICPGPLNDASEGVYTSTIDSGTQMFGIPIQIKDEERADIILDYMAYASEDTLLPAFWETTIKTKRMEDVRDYEMLDIVRNNIRFSWVGMYLGDATLCRDKMLSSGHFSSVWKKYSAKAQKQLDDFIDKIESLD